VLQAAVDRFGWTFAGAGPVVAYSLTIDELAEKEKAKSKAKGSVGSQ
jgi:hypothetical protein